MNFTILVPFVGSHGSIVIGSGGRTITQIMRETGCFIQAEKPNSTLGRHLPFFVIKGQNEKFVNQATIRIQRLLMRSMIRKEQSAHNKSCELFSKIQELELKVSYLEDNGNVSDCLKPEGTIQQINNIQYEPKNALQPWGNDLCSSTMPPISDSDSDSDSEDESIPVSTGKTLRIKKTKNFN